MDPLVIPVATSLIGIAAGYLLRIGDESVRKKLAARKYAFRLRPGVGKGWILQRVRKPAATITNFVVWDAAGAQKVPWTRPDNVVIERGRGGYGWQLDLQPGDMFEVHWTENGEGFSTNQRVFDEDREYMLRRENTGH
ncbi:hypothetical protein [Glaciibacter flavus]|uniref:hypothetical protein n=1 Tax=Orlajensenia flava TaxID=2565934 RepID=UPI003B00C234